MQRQQNYSTGFQSASSLNLHVADPLTSSTSLLCNSTILLRPSTKGQTTAAIVPATPFPGVDIVIYEIVDNQQS